MHYIHEKITGIDNTQADLYGYVLDNSPEIDMNRHRPAILILPGGGYEMTSDREAEPIAIQFAAAGYQAFVLRYSVYPSIYPTSLLQVADSLALIRRNTQIWHLNPDHVALMGFSAGGHLAATLATSSGNEAIREHARDNIQVKPNALLLGYPVITTGALTHQESINHLLGAQKTNNHLLDMLSIEKHVDSNTPPIFVWHTMPDDTVPVENTLSLIQACKKAGASIEAHLFPAGGHGLALGTEETAWGGQGPLVPAIQIWPHLAIDWLNRTFES